MFQILLSIPRYDNYDAVCGWTIRREPYAFLNKRCAVAYAVRWMEMCDDIEARVLPYGADWHSEERHRWNTMSAVASSDDMPF